MATQTQICGERTAERERELVVELREKHVFEGVPDEELARLVASSEDHCAAPGTLLALETEQSDAFMVLLDGQVRITRVGADGKAAFWKKIAAPSFMGEVSLLSNMKNAMTVLTVTEIRGLEIAQEPFWNLMATCPKLRAVVLKEMGYRTRGMQAFAAQQEKLATLGTLTAGLMHELNNPGSAARRAALQLRSNLNRMHQLARSFAEHGHSASQRECLNALQDRILSSQGTVCLSSLEQTDAEEALAEWMDSRGIADAWTMAPVLVNSGIATGDLECLGKVFTGKDFHEPLEWLEATASSVQMVDLVERSVARVAELAHAVKSYAHEGQGGTQDVDVNESIHATLVILKHKFREKNIHLEKQFGGGLPTLHCVCSGLNQVWTNLLDNAIDAVGPEGHIRVRTWSEGDNLCIGIADDGSGITPEDQERIFDPFFTTKQAGIGTGLGLGIVQRVLESYNASLTLRSQPGDTEFLVRIPQQQTA